MTKPEPDAKLESFYQQGAAGRARLAPGLRPAGLRPARRFPAGRWRGPTGSPASWRSMPACSASARSSSGSTGTGVVMLVVAVAGLRLDRPGLPGGGCQRAGPAGRGGPSRPTDGVPGTGSGRAHCCAPVTGLQARLNLPPSGVYTSRVDDRAAGPGLRHHWRTREHHQPAGSDDDRHARRGRRGQEVHGAGRRRSRRGRPARERAARRLQRLQVRPPHRGRRRRGRPRRRPGRATACSSIPSPRSTSAASSSTTRRRCRAPASPSRIRTPPAAAAAAAPSPPKRTRHT